MVINWKMLITPLVVYYVHSAEIDWTDSLNLWLVRVAFGITTIGCLLVRLWIYKIVNATTDERRVRIKQTNKLLPDQVREVTVTEHDLEQLNAAIRTLLLSTVMTVGLHWYHNWILPVIIQSIHQPVALWDSPLFQIHALGLSDSGDHNPLKRPWTQSSNGFEDIWKQAQLMDPKRREMAKADKKKSPKLRR